MVEYYRGLCTFEDAVNAVEETGLATSQAINNLETGITNAIQEMALGIRTDIQQNSYAIVASHKMLADSFVNGFNSINNTLNFSFGYLGNKIDVLSDKICSKLDKIHDILNNPRLTASRELYRNALKDFQNRYYEEALENCTEAIEKNKTDYISWFLLGMIYFCGKSKFSNVLDIKKAEEAFFNAAKYVDAVIGKTEEANIFASEIYYYLGHTRLIISNDYLIENKIEESNKKLLEAEEASRTSYQLSKENLLARYEHAKHLHFLGNDKESLWILEELIRAEKNFAIKSINDKNFESLWGDIRKIIDKLKQELWIPINKKIEESIKKYEGDFEFVFSDYPEIFSKHGFTIDSYNKASNEFRLKYKKMMDNQTYFDALTKTKEILEDLDFSDWYFDFFEPAYNDMRKLEREIENEKNRSALEHLKQSIPSRDEVNQLNSFLETNYENQGFESIIKPKLPSKYKYTRLSFIHNEFKDIHNTIDKIMSSYPISKYDIENIRQPIDLLLIFLEAKRDWEEERKRQEEERKRQKRESKKKFAVFFAIIIIFSWAIPTYIKSEYRQQKIEQRNINGLFKAIDNISPSEVKHFIDLGVDVNQEKNNQTPLQYILNKVNGVYYGQKWYDIVELLVLSGADVNLSNEYYIPICQLIKSMWSIDMHFPSSKKGIEPPLEKYYALFELFIQNGLDMNTRDSDGDTILMFLVTSVPRHELYLDWLDKCCELFINAGADVNAKNYIDETVIMSVQKNFYVENHQKIINILKSYGAK